MGAPTDIIAMALDYMAAPVVTSRLSQEAIAKLMDRHYDPCRKSMLRQFNWHFAEKQGTISRAGTPLFDFLDMYTLPVDLVKFGSIAGPTTPSGLDPALPPPIVPAAPIAIGPWGSSMDYKILGRTLYCNSLGTIAPGVSQPQGAPTINIRYIFDCIDVNQFDPLFLKLVALNLAISTAYSVTQNLAVVDMLNNMLKTELPSAVSMNGQERPPVVVEHSNSIMVRKFGLRGPAGVAAPWTFTP